MQKCADICVDFPEAIQIFSEWIGHGKTRIYSWSNSDLIQLKNECAFKKVPFPANMSRWMDFQIIYPRVMEIRQYKRLMSLHEAAEWYGISFAQKGARRALYDAKITTELVIPVLTGEYISQRESLKKVICRDEREEEESRLSLADLCSGFFNQFIPNETLEPEYGR